jgi:hypothetical protein
MCPGKCRSLDFLLAPGSGFRRDRNGPGRLRLPEPATGSVASVLSFRQLAETMPDFSEMRHGTQPYHLLLTASCSAASITRVTAASAAAQLVAAAADVMDAELTDSSA